MAQRLHDLLEAAVDALPPGRILVAYSGGLDSTVLLHLLSRCAPASRRGLRAVHIDHGIHQDSAAWARQCEAFAQSIGVEFVTRRVDVVRLPDLGLEASARQARYDVIETLLEPGEIVALAHHRDDQVETVLLKLLRGAGPEGIGAMRPLRKLGCGFAWRPLLGLPRVALREYALTQRLNWVSDPSNDDQDIDRNFLRTQVLPRILMRWPEAAASIARSAAWARNAAEYVDGEAARALACMQGLDPTTLRFRQWLALPDALRDPVLRRWLRGLGLAEPTHFQVAELVRQISEAAEDRQPCVRWPGVEVRRYRDLLYAMRPLQFPPLDWSAPFDGTELALPLDLGVLRLAGAPPGARFAQPLHVRFRRGGESLRLAGDGPTRELRDLFQEAGVPPWQRARLPLLFDANDRLVAVADLFVSAAAAELLAPLDACIEWASVDQRPSRSSHRAIDLEESVS